MNSMSIATHCSMLMNGGERIVTAINKTANGGITAAQNNAVSSGALIFSSFDMNMSDVEATSLREERKDLAAMHDIPFNTVFYVTHEGLAEIRSGMSSLPQQAQRALLMIDGFRNAADLLLHFSSVNLNGDEAEKILHDLEDRKFITRMGGTRSNNEVVSDINPTNQFSAERLKVIKQKIINDLRMRLGKGADSDLDDVLGTIGDCESAFELCGALRKAGDLLIIELAQKT